MIWRFSIFIFIILFELIDYGSGWYKKNVILYLFVFGVFRIEIGFVSNFF